MDQTLTLSYEGKEYVITVISSTERYPHFYWCLLDDPYLITLLDDDCVALKLKADGVLHPTEFYQGRAQPLLDCLRSLVVQQCIQPAKEGQQRS